MSFPSAPLFPALLASWIQLNPVAGTPWLVLKPAHLPFPDGLDTLKATLSQAAIDTLYYAPVLMAAIPKGVETPVYLPQPRNGGIERLWYQNWLGTCLCVHESILLKVQPFLKHYAPKNWQDAWHWIGLWLYHFTEGKAHTLPMKHTHWIPYTEARSAWFTLPLEDPSIDTHAARLNAYFSQVSTHGFASPKASPLFTARRQGGQLWIEPLALKEPPRVSIMLPFRDKPELLQQCSASVMQHLAHYPILELVGLNNQSEDPQTLQCMKALTEAHPWIRFVLHDAPFNYAQMHNDHLHECKGEYLLLLNNDIELLTPTWLHDMVTWHVRLSQWMPHRPVGIVGIQLHYPPSPQGFVGIQHAGVTVGIKGEVGHCFKHHPVNKADTWGWLRGVREVMAVTGACMLLPTSLYRDLGEFDATHFPIDFNDIDLCLKATEQGYRNVLLNTVHAIHHESVSRGSKPSTPAKKRQQKASRTYFKQRYHALLDAGDPTYSPAMTLLNESGSAMPLPRMEGNFQQLFSVRMGKGLVKVFRHGHKPWLVWPYYMKRP
ncbi:MAG: glycosyltransferase family 2 protein [Vampirovibrionales bacterium]